MGIYTPNYPAEHNKFFPKILKTFEKYYSSYIILGDFTAVVDPKINRKRSIGQATLRGNKFSSSMHDLVNIMNLKDIWRFKNPGK